MNAAAALPKVAIVAAMSGGVDSSVTAALLQREGYEVIGVTLQLYDAGAARRKGACCAGQDIYDAKRVAENLGIAHYVLDYEQRFRERVIADFAETYARGETPIPCVRCNERVKFADLMETARELGADALATGHYVRRVEGANGAELHRAADESRDQSYFLFATTQAQLSYLRFPLGGMEKPRGARHRRRARSCQCRKAGQPGHLLRGRRALCRLVEKLKPEAARPGEIVDEPAACSAAHDGVIHFTVGQSKGLGLSGNGEPLFVLALDARERARCRRAARIAPHAEHRSARCQLAGGRIPRSERLRGQSPLDAPAGAGARHAGRGRRAPSNCASRKRRRARARPAFSTRMARVLGGGWIARAEARREAAE